MPDITDVMLHEQYSPSEEYKYEVYQTSQGLFDLWLFHYDAKWDGYYMIQDDRHLLESLEQAIAMGDQLMTEMG